ncbi:S1 family peptidase [Achromobacter xylosoxidans]|uniref:S1 family peptidase n=2 Tax=Alcaligenes xylosoxydans xylosoxydans TaxID=85698 RepID=UPI00192C18EB|nr:serine protease [Achromobacter xylosoxidans]
MSADSSPPLFNFKWNQSPLPASSGNNLLVIMATDREGNRSAVGTAFVVNNSDDGRTATCMTAAHVFSEVHRLQNKPTRYNPTALAEFLPRPALVDINPKLVRAIGVVGERVEAATIEGVTYDEATDIALFDVKLQDSSPDGFFCGRFQISDDLPGVGELVCVLSFAGLALEENEDFRDEGYMGTLSRQLMFRAGRVLAHYPTGQRLCKGPCIETSIPVFSGMSGGPLVRFNTEGPMVVCALVSSDPDPDGDDKNNRDIEGRSIFAALPVRVTERTGGVSIAEFLMPAEGGVGTMK